LVVAPEGGGGATTAHVGESEIDSC